MEIRRLLERTTASFASYKTIGRSGRSENEVEWKRALKLNQQKQNFFVSQQNGLSCRQIYLNSKKYINVAIQEGKLLTYVEHGINTKCLSKKYPL